MKTTQIIEALLFASDAPLSAGDLARGEEELDAAAVEDAIGALRAEYDAQDRAFQIYELAGGYQILTRPAYAPHLERFETVPRSSRLSGAALEVLGIVAYRQPIGRAEIEDIRGVGSVAVLRTLQERGMIEVVGRAEGLGRPLLYGTTDRFLEHFGFASLDDLPHPDEMPVVLRERDADADAGAEAEATDEAGDEDDDREPDVRALSPDAVAERIALGAAGAEAASGEDDLGGGEAGGDGANVGAEPDDAARADGD